MQQSTTDIDRKLAIYYHPLFQQAMNLITDLFQKNQNHLENDIQKINQQNNISLNSRKQNDKFSLGLMEFIQFNLKLQKCLLPTFQSENAIISGLNDWVKQVAQCLNFDGMVIMTSNQQINESNLENILRTEIIASNIQLYESTQKYIRTLSKLKNHDAFKLLNVKVNKEVFSKFMFDLCSTWCQFLDIQMFSYFLIAVYLQISEGLTLEQSKFKSTHMIQPIDLQFMQQFQEIKHNYSKNRKKQLRYYRAWCEWNYLRVGEVGQGLILCLDKIIDDDRVLLIALMFQKAIKVINEQITSQSQVQSPQETILLKNKQNQQKDFLIMKKISAKEKQGKFNYQNDSQNMKIERSIESKNDEKSSQNGKQYQDKGNKNEKNGLNIQKQKSLQREGTIRIHSRNQTILEDQLEGKKNQQSNETEEKQIYQIESMQNEHHHEFEIEIDELGNMYLKRIIKMPVLGERIKPLDFDTKKQLKLRWIQSKKQQSRKISNLYRRLDNMKVRLQHNIKNDHYFYKKSNRLAQRDLFYAKQLPQKKSSAHYQNKSIDQPIFQKSIHQKPKPLQYKLDQNQNNEPPQSYLKPNHYRSTLKNQKQNDPIRKNQQYIHKVIAPSFLTDHKNNLSHMEEKQGSIYGVGAQDQRRQIKFNLPKIKFLRDYKVKNQKSFHIIGKLTKNREIINEKVKSMSNNQKTITGPLGIPTQEEKIKNLKNQYPHVWSKYINEEEIAELNDFRQFYKRLEKYKKSFSEQYESAYRQNLRPILLYENKRYEMGGVITRKDQQKFFQKMKKLINKDERRKKKKQKKHRFREYKKKFKNKNQRSFYQQVFINYHKKQINEIKQQRSRIRSEIVKFSSTAH